MQNAYPHYSTYNDCKEMYIKVLKVAKIFGSYMLYATIFHIISVLTLLYLKSTVAAYLISQC